MSGPVDAPVRRAPQSLSEVASVRTLSVAEHDARGSVEQDHLESSSCVAPQAPCYDGPGDATVSRDLEGTTIPDEKYREVGHRMDLVDVARNL
jgi:hypothetical protein